MDDKSKRGGPDRQRVSSTEPYEVRHISEKFDLPPPLVKKVIEQVGPMRVNVERKLQQMKENGKK